jgi:hypothetical protein
MIRNLRVIKRPSYYEHIYGASASRSRTEISGQQAEIFGDLPSFASAQPLRWSRQDTARRTRILNEYAERRIGIRSAKRPLFWQIRVLVSLWGARVAGTQNIRFSAAQSRCLSNQKAEQIGYAPGGRSA